MSKSSFSCFIILILILVIAIQGFSQTRSGKLGIGVGGSMQYMLGAGTTNPSSAIGGGVNFSYSMMESFGLRGNFCYSPISWKSGTLTSNLQTDMASLNLYTGIDMMPNSKFNIFPFIGGGLAVFDPRDDNGGASPSSGGKQVSSFDLHFIGGLSIDFFLNEFWSVSLMGEYVMTGSPYYAGSVEGATNISKNDSYMQAGLQIRYYFFDSAFISKLLNAQRERSKQSK